MTWQGWAIVLGYAVAIKLLHLILPGELTRAIVSIAIAAPLVAIVYAKTDGGVHGRWGARVSALA